MKKHSDHFVLCIEGMTGVGKTTLARTMESLGYSVVYADEIIFSLLHLPPTQRQVRWISEWFSVVSKRLETTVTSRERPLIVDRSPFAGAMYWPEGGRPGVAIDLVRELLRESGLGIFTVCMKQRRKTLLRRIEKRSKVQRAEQEGKGEHESRQTLNEFDVGWFDTVLRRFNYDYRNLWDAYEKVANADKLLQLFQSDMVSPFTYEMKMDRQFGNAARIHDVRMKQKAEPFSTAAMCHFIVDEIGVLHPILHEIFSSARFGNTFHIPPVSSNDADNNNDGPFAGGFEMKCKRIHTAYDL